MSEPNRSPDPGLNEVRSGTRRRGRYSPSAEKQIALSFGVLFALAFCFFVARRIYYRAIQPAPAWEHPTSKRETIVADKALAVTLWADESLVRNPTSISVDASGRVWVTEAVNYRNWNNSPGDISETRRSAGDRIVVLEDSDGDGRADRSTVFAQDEELVAPTGICVLENRVFVSCSPNIFVFYDDDHDGRADRREVFLSGFGGRDHDHGVHSISPGPDGRLYFSVGNAGPHIVTDRSGWTLRAGSYYQPFLAGADMPRLVHNSRSKTAAGQNMRPARVIDEERKHVLNSGRLVSDDGRIYVGGLALSVLPDGSDLKVHSHNARNPYEVCVDSFGNIWQADNDDTGSCRISWLMDGSNQGFASADGSRSWQADQRPGQGISQAHWHQEDPGVLPAGEIYGTGAPTGIVRYEGEAFGPAFSGLLLVCDAGLGCVYGIRPVVEGAGYRFEKQRLIWSEPEEKINKERRDGLSATWFRPTDVAIAPNGNFFVADWYDSYVGAHRVNDPDAIGQIYLVRPASKRGPSAAEPRERLSRAFTPGQDLNPVSQSHSPEARAATARHIRDEEGDWLSTDRPAKDRNIFSKARELWSLSDEELVQLDLTNDSDGGVGTDQQLMISVLRRLLPRDGIPELTSSDGMANLPPMVRRELALSLRHRPLEEIRPLLMALAGAMNPADRFEVEAFGLACEGHEESIFPELRLRFGDEPTNWTDRFRMIVWRLHPVAALPDLRRRIQIESLVPAEIRFTVDAIGFVGASESIVVLQDFLAQREGNFGTLTDDSSAYVRWWIDRLRQTVQDGHNSSGKSEAVPLPVRFRPASKIHFDNELIREVTGREGSVARGQRLFFSTQAACAKCHQFQGQGGEVGPDLTMTARRLDEAQLLESILYPSASILTGYENWTVIDTQGRTYNGLLMSTGSDIVLKSAEGKRLAVSCDHIEELIRNGHSLMPDSHVRLLSKQDLADLVAFLQQ